MKSTFRRIKKLLPKKSAGRHASPIANDGSQDGETGESSSTQQVPTSASHGGPSSITIEPTLDVAGDELESPFTLETIHAAALKQLKKSGHLSPADYQRVEGANRLQDILDSVDVTVSQNIASHSKAEKVAGILKSMLERLGRFESAIDMLAQSMPQVLGLSLVGIIWGSLKCVLAVAHDNMATMDAVVTLWNEVLTNKLQVLYTYIDMYGESRIKLLETPLVDLYAKLIAFAMQATKLSDSSIHGRSSLQKDIRGLIDEIRNAEELVHRMALIEHMNQTMEARKDERRDKIYQWLSAPDASLAHNDIREKWQPDTGTWFIEGEDFRKWKEHPNFSLWLRAIPGGGKTMLCSSVIDDILQLCQADSTSTLAYFYFTDKYRIEDVIRSVIKQLVAQCSSIPEALSKLYDTYQRNQQRPNMPALTGTIPSILEGFQHIYLIFDAIDECPERTKLLDWLEEIITTKPDGLHLLVTGRRERDIENRLGRLISATIEMESAVDKDIGTYLCETLQTDPFFTNKRWPEEVYTEIRETLMKKARGMFRWVALQLESLKFCRNRNQVSTMLKSLPKDLPETYDRILSRIRDEDYEYAYKTLQCLAFSIRPMTVEEVAEVIAFNMDTGQLDQTLDNPLDILEICSSLVTISSSPGDGIGNRKEILALSHFTVKEYLISPRIQSSRVSRYGFDRETAEVFMCQVLVTYLMQFNDVDGLNRDTIGNFPLAYYGAEFWTVHGKAMGKGTLAVRNAILAFLQRESAQYTNWIRIHDLDMPWRHELADRADVRIQPLYYISLAGMEDIAKLLLDNNANVNAQGGRYGNALHAASSRGHEAVVRLLLDNNADVNAQEVHIGNALQAASAGGHESVVRLLIDNKADVNAQGEKFGNALQAASFGGHEAIVRLLLDNNANINAQGGHYGTTLQAASHEGHEDVVQLLLDNNADVNAQGGVFGNALQAASFRGHEAVVRLLLDNNADVNAQGGIYGNALQPASAGGHEAVVRLLLDNNSDVNAQGGIYGNALQAASAEGHESVVRLLLDNNADVHARGGEYGNALQAASLGGHEAVVRLLLDNNAHVDARGGKYGNALQAASAGGHEAVVQLLLHNNADVNAQGGEYGNALQAASFEGHEAVVRLLLDNNADVDAQGGEYGNTLQAALAGGHEAIVRLLLDNNADVHTQGGRYGNALQTASLGGHEAVVRLLLHNNADVNAQGGEYGNALQAASSRGHEAVVRLLLDNNADVNAQGGEYGNALHAASSRGHEAVVRLLLDNNADVHAEGGFFGNALQVASAGGHEAIVLLLLHNNADVNAQGGQYGNALQAASFEGHKAVVQLLLNNNADVRAQGGRYGNALQAASAGGHEAVVRLLLHNNPDVNAQGGPYANALQAASAGAHEAIVRLLLDSNADVHAQGGFFGNALQAALYRGDEAVVRLLLDNNADINAHGRRHGNALQAASSADHQAVLELLLDKNPEP